jgi:predicted DNA-binding transcriptional regulator YafY
MAKTSHQKAKMLHLAQILLENTDDEHGLTRDEITAELNERGISAERKTLYDDIEVLKQFGIDIEMRKDKVTRYHVISRDFELPELKLLVDAVQASKFITRKKSTELIKKISANTSRYNAQKLNRQVFVSNRIKTMNESIYYSVDYIHEAINSNSKISFQYFDWNEKKQKEFRHDGKRYCVSPWALSWDDENYYMIGYDEDKIKHYRVDKMASLAILDEKRDGEDVFRDFDTAVYSKKTFGMFAGEEETVTLRCADKMAGVIIDRFGQETAFFHREAGFFEVHVPVAVSPLFFAWVMNFGEDVKIISPQHVKEEFVKSLSQTLAQYKE